ncbi:MAG: PDZ domain-containing protein [Saprospiraceae bacterium]|nr:PDZ domain-containing protein [Saprospiraceae bacterium]
MKKMLTYAMPWALILPLSMMTLQAQNVVEKQSKPTEEKTIVVTIKEKTADGSTNSTTIMKSGEEAKNFDVKKYIKEQTKDKPNAIVIVRDKMGATNGTTVNVDVNEEGVKTRTIVCIDKNDHKIHERRMSDTWQNQGDKPFLGVSELYDRTKPAEGVRVAITRNSGAAQAGLKDDDVILQLNQTPINSFRDISAFMRTAKAGDKVAVLFERDGKTKTVNATLGKQSDTWTQTEEKEKEACLGVYTSTRVVDDKRGAIIEDFTKVSAAQEANMQLGDVITQVNGIRVKTHQDVWDEIAKYKPKSTVRVTYLRDKEEKNIVATLKACKPKDESVIVVPKTQEGTVTVNPDTQNTGKLTLESFAASPNPTKEMVNIAFKGEAVPTTVSFLDLTGKVLFQQTLSDFNGEYNQRFDVSEYAKGVVVVKVQQGEKVFSKQIVVN